MITSIRQLVEQMKSRYADRLAYQYILNDEIIQVSFRQYAEDIEMFAAYLHDEFSDIRGKHIGLLADNSYRYTVCMWGIILAGGVAVPVNERETVEFIGNELAHADVTCLLTDDVIPGNSLIFHGEIRNIWEGLGVNQRKEFASGIYDMDVDRMALLLYTSGTTGSNKGVMISQRNLFASLQVYINQNRSLRELLHMKKSSAILMLPMYHMYAICTVLMFNHEGMCINMCNELKYIDRDMENMESDYAPIVPAMLNKWYKDLICGRYKRLDTLKVINCAGAMANATLFNTFQENGIRIVQFYGLTETAGPIVFHISDKPDKLKSVGMLGTGAEIKLQDGEICIRSEAVTQGYYKDPEATQTAIRDGWLYTGDLGYLDEDGFLYITGRKKNLIILSGGENVSPEELEGILLQNDKVKEIVVCEDNGRICAEIYSDEIDQDEVRKYISEINRTLASYKRINKIVFRNGSFPKTSTGKIKRMSGGEDDERRRNTTCIESN